MDKPVKRLNYVDEMRGLAILMVALVHTAQGVLHLSRGVIQAALYGQLGVQLFFVASAYTLCRSFERRSSEPHRLGAFYLRRYFRIAPLYYLAIPVYFFMNLWHASMGTGTEASLVQQYSWVNVLSNIAFLHGFVPTAYNAIVPGGWSIGTEMAFYAVFPFIFLYARGPLKGKPARLLLLFGFFLAADLAIQVAIMLVSAQSIKNNNFLFFNAVNQMPVFIAGMVLYFAQTGEERPAFLESKAFSAAACLLSFAAVVGLWLRQPFLWPALFPAVAAVSFAFLLNWLRLLEKGSRLLAEIGFVSYSMYIFHFIFAWTLIPLLFRGLYGSLPPVAILALSYVLTVACTYLAAKASERFIEEKGIALGSRVIAAFAPKKA